MIDTIQLEEKKQKVIILFYFISKPVKNQET